MNFHDYVHHSMPDFINAWWWTAYPGETPWDWLTRHGIGLWWVLLLAFALISWGLIGVASLLGLGRPVVAVTQEEHDAAMDAITRRLGGEQP